MVGAILQLVAGIGFRVPANGDLGDVQRVSNTALRVGEIQALNGRVSYVNRYDD